MGYSITGNKLHFGDSPMSTIVFTPPGPFALAYIGLQ